MIFREVFGRVIVLVYGKIVIRILLRRDRRLRDFLDKRDVYVEFRRVEVFGFSF